MVRSMIIYYFGLAKKYIVVHPHGPLSLYTTKLESHQLQGWVSLSCSTTFG